MKKLARFLSYLSAILSSLTLIFPRSETEVKVLLLLKPLSGALSPFLVLAGGLGAFLGLLHRDRSAVRAGLFGAAIATRHVVKVTEPHDGFTQAFGPDWRSQVPPDLRKRMLPQRYQPIPPEPLPAQWQRDVVVGTHVETGDPLLADLWQPPDGIPHTGLAIIYLHGSAWHYLDKDMGTRRFLGHLAAQGHVVVDLAYTLAPKAQLHAMVADVKRAIAWMKVNAADYGVNPERIVLMGGSAGAHLALLTAYTPNHPELDPADIDADTSVRAVVSFYGFPDLEASQEHFRTNHADFFAGRTRFGQWINRQLEFFFYRIRFLPPYGKFVTVAAAIPGLLGGSPDQVPQLYHLGSPIHHVGPHCPPTLQLQGAHDVGGMMPDVARLHGALRKAGIASVHVEFPNTDHGFDLFFPKWSPAAQAATYDTERFLALMM